MQVIIFPNDNGGVSVITPAPEFADQIEAVAEKDVPNWDVWINTEVSEENPEGGYYESVPRPWRIIDADELPPYELRSLWLWTEAGALVIGNPPPPAVPDEVSRLQARAGLIVYGEQIGRPNLIDEVDAIVAGLTAGTFGLTSVQVRVIKEAWSNAQVIRRDSPALNMIFPALGLKLPEQLDALFIVAAQQVA